MTCENHAIEIFLWQKKLELSKYIFLFSYYFILKQFCTYDENRTKRYHTNLKSNYMKIGIYNKNL